jgi:hypothetical protein
MRYVGDYAEDATVYFQFTTSDSNGGAVAPSTAFEEADLVIYKDNGVAQKTSTNGITMTSPFDSVTGLHAVAIDTSNDTGDAGFWVTGADYMVVLNPDETVDSQTVVAVVCSFSIENRFSIPAGIESDIIAIESELIVVHSETTVIASDTAAIEGWGDPSSDLAAIESELIVVHSETTAIQTDTGNIYSDTTIVVSDTTAIESELIQVHSETTAIQAWGDPSSDLAAIESELIVVHSETTAIQTDTGNIYSDTTIIVSDTTAIESELIVVHSETTAIQAWGDPSSDLAAIESELIVVHSETTAIQTDTGNIYSDTTIIVSDTTAIHSQTTVIESDVALLDAAQAEPTGVPAANESPLTKIGYLFMVMRNKRTMTSAKLTIFGDDDVGEWEHDLSDNGTTTTVSEGNAI